MTSLPELTIESLDHKGRGVARIKDTRFVCEAVLPGERIRVVEQENCRRHMHVLSYKLLSCSSRRVVPGCQYFDTCGGCQLQHLDYAQQVNMKQQSLADLLQSRGDIQPAKWLVPLTGEPYHYRRRARLAVYQLNDKTIIIGFRQRKHTFINDLQHCPVLEQRLNVLLPPLHGLVASLSCANRVPQIELTAGDDQVAVVVRHLVPLSDSDMQNLAGFARQYDVLMFTQADGPETVTALSHDMQNRLYSTLALQDISFGFVPTDFIQANAQQNQRLVETVIAALELQPNDQVLDLFCGLGNFTLPVARTGAVVTGVDSSSGLLERAASNARKNRLAGTTFMQLDLHNSEQHAVISNWRYNKLILDPPREGAIEVLKNMPDTAIEKLVYVSCEPRTLARDLAYLVNRRGYRLESIQLVDMFPQTVHTESISVLTRQA